MTTPHVTVLQASANTSLYWGGLTHITVTRYHLTVQCSTQSTTHGSALLRSCLKMYSGKVEEYCIVKRTVLRQHDKPQRLQQSRQCTVRKTANPSQLLAQRTSTVRQDCQSPSIISSKIMDCPARLPIPGNY